MYQVKKASLHYAITAALAFALLCFSACTENQPRTNQAANGQKADTTKKAEKSATGMALTLPVLDALFYEDGFEAELTSKLALNKSQVERLKTLSHESVADLAEDGVGEYSGSERVAIQKADEQIRGILGEDKARQLYQFVNDRYSGGDIAGMMPATPNAVPKDTRIVVNAAAYRMDVFQDGKLTKTYRVGIGYPEFPLPTGMRRAEKIIFNPTWTPPSEPWVKGKFKPGKTVVAGSKDNPLGPIKIPIGLPNLIHGGKAPAKLGGFASHGCVGLTNDMIRDFAVTIAQLGGSPIAADSISTFGDTKSKTHEYKLANAVPVELRYETIVAENGGLRIYRDVYERGTNTLENARRVLDVYGISYDKLPDAEKQTLQQALQEMNRDPQGKTIIADAGMPSDSATATTAQDLDSGRRDGVAASKVARSKKGKTTQSVVGRKEIAVPISELNGKGYPAPVNLVTGAPVAASNTMRQ